MKIESIWTENEGRNVLYALRQKYGDLAPRTLIKYAVRELVEVGRLSRSVERMKEKSLLGCPFCHKPGLEVEDGNVTCATKYCALWCVRIPRLAWQTRSQPNAENQALTR